MAKATPKTTPKRAPRKGVKAATPGPAEIVARKILSDPIFSATRAYEKALGRSMAMPDDLPEPKRQELFDAVNRAEVEVAETVPTTLQGIEASARWYRRFLAFHDGPENINGHEVLETWPQTICTAFQNFGLRSDPTHNAVTWHCSREKALNECKAPEASKEYKEAERRMMAAYHDMQRTIPTTGPGLAVALEAFFEDAEPEITEGQRDWFRLLVAAARALS